jgi:O-6-methylguanine DNA methyltransferase
MKTFKQKVFEVVSKIPRGETLTYKEVAKMSGSPKAYRAVGSVLSTNYNPQIPCHRVIGSDGKMRGYNRGIQNKIKKLKEERQGGDMV